MEDQKISIFRSLAAKLFYCMTGLVVVTVAGNSFQHYRTFSRYLAEQVASSTVSRSETASGQIESQLDNWKSQLGTVIPTYTGDVKLYEDILERFVNSNSDFLAVRVYTSPSKTSSALTMIANARTKNTTDARFEDKAAGSAITSALRESRKNILKSAKSMSVKGKNVAVASVAKKTGLPLMMVVARFDVENSQESLWAVVIGWQSSLIKSLPKSAYIDTVIVDNKGTVFAANNLALLTRQARFQSEGLLKVALSGKKISDFVPEYRSSNDRRVIGGYARLPQYGLTILTEEDIENAYEELRHSQMRTILWAVLFVLIAMAFAYYGAAGTTRNLRLVTEATRRIASGDFDNTIDVFSRDETAALADSINTMSSEIVKLMRQNVAKAEYEKELATAKLVQSTFFPKKAIVCKNLRASGFYQPATQCGGDLWGHYELGEDRHLLYIGDAMGHGAPAALVTAMAYSVSTTIAQLAAGDRQLLASPSEFLTFLNKIIYEAVEGSISMTAFVALIDTRVGKMTCANAGHNFPFVLPATKKDPRQPKSSRETDNAPAPISMRIRGNPLGMTAKSRFEEKEYELKPGDKIFLFTDGLIECSSPRGEVWGRKHLVAQLTESATLAYDELKDEILSRAFSFYNGRPLEDDVTVVVAEIPKSWRPMTTSTTSFAAPERSTPRATVSLPPVPVFAEPELPVDEPAAEIMSGIPPLAPVFAMAEMVEDAARVPAAGANMEEVSFIPDLARTFENMSVADQQAAYEISNLGTPELNLEDNPENIEVSVTPQTEVTSSDTEKKRRSKGRYKIKLPSAG
jgi:serine phosphatase RsbU (regulator of sigma subunit)